MKTAAERIRVVDKLRHQHPEKSPEEITDMADLVARTHPQFRRGRRRSMLVQALPWILAAVAGLVATKEAKCQTTTIYLENAGTQQAGGPATYRLNCDGSTVICNWTAATRTWTITSTGGGGGSPVGSTGTVQANDAGTFGVTTLFYDKVTGLLGINTSTPYATMTIDAGAAKGPGLTLYEDGATCDGTFQGYPALFQLCPIDGNTYWQFVYSSAVSGLLKNIANFQDGNNSLQFQHDFGAGVSNNTLLVYGGFSAASVPSGHNPALYEAADNTGNLGWEGGTGDPASNTPVLTWDYTTNAVTIPTELDISGVLKYQGLTCAPAAITGVMTCV